MVGPRVIESRGWARWTRLSASMSKVMATATLAPFGQGTGLRIMGDDPRGRWCAIRHRRRRRAERQGPEAFRGMGARLRDRARLGSAAPDRADDGRPRRS